MKLVRNILVFLAITSSPVVLAATTIVAEGKVHGPHSTVQTIWENNSTTISGTLVVNVFLEMQTASEKHITARFNLDGSSETRTVRLNSASNYSFDASKVREVVIEGHGSDSDGFLASYTIRLIDNSDAGGNNRNCPDPPGRER